MDVETGAFSLIASGYPHLRPGNPDQVIEVIRRIVEHFNWEGKIGAGFPGPVRKGVIHFAANMSHEWIGEDLSTLIHKATGARPATVLNDADAAGLAEMRFGEGKRYEDDYVLFLTIGTGIGSAFLSKVKLWPNSELGHMQIAGKGC
jgi:polyphosphate glucokinase